MGGFCCIKNQSVGSEDLNTEKEVFIDTYSSAPDKEVSKLETKYNLLREIQFSDYLYSLQIFEMSNATLTDDYAKKGTVPISCTESFYSDDFGLDLIQSFIENKIFKHPSLYVKAGNDELLTTTFKEMISLIIKSLMQKLSQNEENNGNKIKVTPQKHHAIALGLLLCGGTNISKIHCLFDLFSQDGRLSKREEFSKFLLSMFLISSYCMIYARKKLPESNGDIENLDTKVMTELLDALELKDSVNLVKVVEKDLFGNNQSYSYEEFKGMFSKGLPNSIGWLLTTKGIRKMQEQNNV